MPLQNFCSILGKRTVPLTSWNRLWQDGSLLHEGIQRCISVIKLHLGVLYAIKESCHIKSRRVESREILLNILFQLCKPLFTRHIVDNGIHMELRPSGLSVLFLHVVTRIDHIKRNIRKRRPNICRCFPLARRNVFCKRIRIRVVAVHGQAVSFSESLFAAVSLNCIFASVGSIRILATDMVELRDLFQVIHRFDLSLERIASVLFFPSYTAVLQRDGRQTHRRPPSFLVVYSCRQIYQLLFLHDFSLCIQ